MLGIGEGKIDVQINKYSFAPGETIGGTISMQLKKPIKARGLIASLIGERTVRRNTGKGTTTTTEKVFEFKYPVDGEKEYPASTPLNYMFSIKIPPDAIGTPAGGAPAAVGVAMDLARAFIPGMGGMRYSTDSPVRWYVLVRLDMPWSFDISKKIQINIA
jgi:hypothetical protein